MEELRSHNKELLKKKMLVVANKIDLLDNVKEDPGMVSLRNHCREKGLDLVEISAVKEINLNTLKSRLFELLHGE